MSQSQPAFWIVFLFSSCPGSAVTVRTFIPEQIRAVGSSVLRPLGESSWPAGTSYTHMHLHAFSHKYSSAAVIKTLSFVFMCAAEEEWKGA